MLNCFTSDYDDVSICLHLLLLLSFWFLIEVVRVAEIFHEAFFNLKQKLHSSIEEGDKLSPEYERMADSLK